MKKPTKSRVRSVLKDLNSASHKRLAEQFGTRRELTNLLKRMEQDGSVIQDRSGRYRLPDPSPASIRENKSVPSSVTGVIKQEEGRWMLSPLTPGYSHAIQLTSGKRGKVGDIARVRLLHQSRFLSRGSVQNLISYENEADRASLCLLHAYDVPQGKDWPNEVFKIPKTVSQSAVQSRKDLRDLAFVTIDGESARDFDDAVYVTDIADSGWKLYVAIADVAHYVKSGSALDREARNRGNSVYLPDRVVPMLPEQLSNGICSLVPDEDRLAVVSEMDIARNGEIEKFEFYEATIRSVGRLTYADAVHVTHDRLKGRSKAINDSMLSFFRAYKALRTKRVERGALDFTSREASVHVSHGHPIRVELHSQNEAHRMIEEAMIAANVAAADFLAQRNVPTMYRIHDKPDNQSVLELRRTLSQFSLAGIRSALRTPKGMQSLLDQIRESTESPWIWEIQVLRTLVQAQYSYDNVGHFGLALSRYLHFTSPIRRYSDLYVHRLIKTCIKRGNTPELDRSSHSELAQHLSTVERRADVVSRRTTGWLTCVLLTQRIGDTFEGTITGVEEFGIFVELDEYLVSGLIHVTALHDDFYVFDGSVLQGRDRGRSYSLGDRLTVRLMKVEVELGRLDLIDEKMERHSRSTRKRRSRRK